MKPARIVNWLALVWLAAILLRASGIIRLSWKWLLIPVDVLAVCGLVYVAGGLIVWGYLAVLGYRLERRARRRAARLGRLFREGKLVILQPGEASHGGGLPVSKGHASLFIALDHRRANRRGGHRLP